MKKITINIKAKMSKHIENIQSHTIDTETSNKTKPSKKVNQQRK